MTLSYPLVCYEAHTQPAHCLADRLGIGGVVLVALDVGLYELRCDQLHAITERSKLARPVVRTTASFHTDFRLELALNSKQPLDRGGAKRADQFVFEVRVAHEKSKRLRARATEVRFKPHALETAPKVLFLVCVDQ